MGVRGSQLAQSQPVSLQWFRHGRSMTSKVDVRMRQNAESSGDGSGFRDLKSLHLAHLAEERANERFAVDDRVHRSRHVPNFMLWQLDRYGKTTPELFELINLPLAQSVT